MSVPKELPKIIFETKRDEQGEGSGKSKKMSFFDVELDFGGEIPDSESDKLAPRLSHMPLDGGTAGAPRKQKKGHGTARGELDRYALDLKN